MLVKHTYLTRKIIILETKKSCYSLLIRTAPKSKTGNNRKADIITDIKRYVKPMLTKSSWYANINTRIF